MFSKNKMKTGFRWATLNYHLNKTMKNSGVGYFQLLKVMKNLKQLLGYWRYLKTYQTNLIKLLYRKI